MRRHALRDDRWSRIEHDLIESRTPRLRREPAPVRREIRGRLFGNGPGIGLKNSMILF